MNRRQMMKGMNRRMEYDIKGHVCKEKEGKVVSNKEKSTGSVEASGVVYANVGVGETTYEMNKFQTRQGHGFAAERAEHINDMYHGKKVQILGDNNAKNGADRLVNGIEIQSKYCKSGAACIQECFENGNYRYYTKNGEPMCIEVPSDMYDGALRAMERRIENNEVKGITDPRDAEKLVKKGHYTYNQVRQIAQAGTIESLSFDAANGIIVAKDAMGISALVTFATSIWNGEDMEKAFENAALCGLKVGGVSFLTTVISSQIARTSIQTSVRTATDIVVGKLGPKVTSYIANALRNGNNIYGAAAMKNVSKLISGNFIANTVSLVILSVGDIIDIFRGRISGKQFVKDVTVTGATIGGGSVGWSAGNAVGGLIGGTVGGIVSGGAATAQGAKIGAKIGGVAASIMGGGVAGKAAKGVMDKVIEDDSQEMLRIVEQEFVTICQRYLLTENEIYEMLSLLKEKLSSKELKKIYSSENRELYAQSIVLDCTKAILHKRVRIDNVQDEDIVLGVRMLVEDAIEGEGIFSDEEGVALSQIQENTLENTNITEEQMPQIMQEVKKMNQSQECAEHCLRSIKRNNEDTKYYYDKILQERQSLKKELNKILDQ